MLYYEGTIYCQYIINNTEKSTYNVNALVYEIQDGEAGGTAPVVDGPDQPKDEYAREVCEHESQDPE